MRLTTAIALLAAILLTPPSRAGKRDAVDIGGKRIGYTATPGTIDLLNDSGGRRGTIFHIAYTRNGVDEKARKKRPIAFVFNGGPGSSSAWLHLGAFGPQRLVLGDAGLTKPEAPHRTTANAHSILDVADLVFIDPIGTGFSRAADIVAARTFYSFRGDVRSVAEFIKLYLEKHERKESPCFLIGESYGAMRACGLVPELEEKHKVVVNGIVLISGPIVMGRRSPSDHLLPTAASIAHYHGLLDDSLQGLPRGELLRRVDSFVEEDYKAALADPDALDDESYDRIADQVERFTGLDRLRGLSFSLREVRALVGRELDLEGVGVYDARVTTTERSGRFRGAGSDPAMKVIGEPMEAVMGDYLIEDLGFDTDLEYRLLNRMTMWSHRGSRASSTLKRALKTNRGLRVFVATGLYDTVTPTGVVRHAVEEAEMTPEQRKGIEYRNYEGGHMMYTNIPELERLSGDVRKFIRSAAKRKRGPALVPVSYKGLAPLSE